MSSSTTTTTTPSAIPTSQRAIVQDAEGRPQILDRFPVPALLPGTVLVKTSALALNPSDYKMASAFPAPGAVVGHDFVGRIAAVADGITHLTLGDVVCGGVRGSNADNLEDGAFAEYVRIPMDLALRPTSLTIGEAATLGTSSATCALALWAADALDLLPATPDAPSQTPMPILVYGGSTASGTMAIQLLRLSGFCPIATCSPRNFDLVRSFGADAVFDYMDPNVAMSIKSHTHGQLKHALDCISDKQSVECCYAAIARVGGRYVSLELVSDELLAKRRAIQACFVLSYEALGKDVNLPGGYGKPANADKHELWKKCLAIYQRLLDKGQIMTHPTQVMENGLSGVLDGLELLRTGSVSGKKLIAYLE